jgi:uncharacterized membrane protein YfcA
MIFGVAVVLVGFAGAVMAALAGAGIGSTLVPLLASIVRQPSFC